VVNSILANSYSGGNCSVSGGSTITDGGHNIDDKATCAFSTANGSLNNTDPKLATALENNGGPTQTLAIGAMSPAINAGNETVCAAPPVNNLDQRGFVRPGMGATNCSIGAYEFNAAPSATTTPSTTTPSTTITLPCTSARCTLGAARTSAACAGQTIPASVTGKFSTAETLIDQAASNSGRKAQRLLKKAKMALKKAEAKASRAAKGKHAKISSNCAMALKGAAEGVIAGLGV